MFYRFKIYNLQNKSFSPVEVCFTGTKVTLFYHSVRLAFCAFRVYKNYSLKAVIDDDAQYDLIVYDEKTGLQILGVDLEEDFDSTDLISST